MPPRNETDLFLDGTLSVYSVNEKMLIVSVDLIFTKSPTGKRLSPVITGFSVHDCKKNKAARRIG